MKKLLLTLGVSMATLAPIATIVACGNHDHDHEDEEPILETDILASFTHHFDIAHSLGAVPAGIAVEGMGTKTPYLDDVLDDIQIEGYINTFGTLDPIEMNILKSKYKTIMGSYGSAKDLLEPYFDDILLTTSEPILEGTKETLTMKLSDHSEEAGNGWGGTTSYVGSRDFQALDFYYNWREIGKQLDVIYEGNTFEDNAKELEEKTKTRINELKAAISDEIEDKSLLIYDWGGRTAPGGEVAHDINDLDHYQGVVTPQMILGSFLYSNEVGLGFDLPSFDHSKNSVIAAEPSWGTITNLENGIASLRESLEGQNDYVLFTAQEYDNPWNVSEVGTEMNKLVIDKTDSDSDGLSDNVFWPKDFAISTASYGPKGLNYIIDWVADIFDVTLTNKF